MLWDLFPDGARLGGAAGNVAIHAAQLGAQVSLVSRVGCDELGDRACAELAAAGIDVSLVQRDPERPTGTVAVTLVRGEPSFRIADEVAWDRLAWTRETAAAVGAADVLYFGTLAQRTVLGAGALSTAWAGTRPGCLRVCDLNVRPPFAEPSILVRSVAHADVVKLNEDEAKLLSSCADAADSIAWLLGRGVQLVALTRGGRGCTLATTTERVDCPAHPLSSDRGDAVGAGDAFVAVLVAELGGSGRGRLALGELGARANRVAAYVASVPGATPCLPASLRGGAS